MDDGSDPTIREGLVTLSRLIFLDLVDPRLIKVLLRERHEELCQPVIDYLVCLAGRRILRNRFEDNGDVTPRILRKRHTNPSRLQADRSLRRRFVWRYGEI